MTPNYEQMWDIFDVAGRPEIQKSDEADPGFSSDWEALGYVFQGAAIGNEVHQEALLHCYPNLIKQLAARLA